MGAATSHDVARRARVSIATVSRVLNDLPHVTPAVRHRVLRAIRELDYQPSRAAQRLRAKRSRVIGLIISDIENPFFTGIAREIEDVASQRGYSLLVCNTDEEVEKERLYINVMRAEEVAGVILAAASERNSNVRSLIEQNIPVVAIDRCLKDSRIDTVMTANIKGAREAVSHLIQLGHRRVGFIGLPLERTSGRERLEGYESTLRKHRLSTARQLVRIGDGKEASGYRHAKELLRVRPPITALFVANNLMTLGALSALHDLGARVPDEISLVGFDDMLTMPLLNPPLTTVAQPTRELGRQAAILLLERINRSRKPVTHLRLSPTFVVRGSSGPVPR